MRQQYHPYTLWEDWVAGMYRCTPVDTSRLEAAGDLLTNTTSFYDTAVQVTAEWRFATEHNLTDLSQNRRAWLGQASATYAVGATQTETCIAWNTRMTEEERHAANHVADVVIDHWYSRSNQLELFDAET